jgi:hypothetical protein
MTIDIELLRRIREQLEVSAEQLRGAYDEPLDKACFNHCKFNEHIKPRRRDHNLHVAQQNRLLADEVGRLIEMHIIK